jgi:transcription-repair coupling factor (superfamily II helicase)
MNKLFDILIDLNGINENDLVIHKEYGVGRFLLIVNLLIKNKKHDCLKIEYLGGDILYLPVENINRIKKYGSDDAELDKLGSKAFARKREKLKEKISQMAKQIIDIAAKRKVAESIEPELDLELYQKFCSNFPYKETKDQLSAIKDVENDFNSGYVSERLVCGDVGFGKTEVGLRAMGIMALGKNKIQSCFIAPTTVLARQHYESIVSRFEGFNVKIAEFSRFVDKNTLKNSKEQLKLGQIDIAVGTHALLAKDVEFSNLGLLIIDEEQSFGVAQKEKLKSYKQDIHVLSLSATPIPRSLQMSLSGIKDLSIIATPPKERIPIKTIVTKCDYHLATQKLLEEKARGGVSFYVLPKIKYLENVAATLSEISKGELRICVAHGQMKPKEIEDVLSKFKNGLIDVLVSTNIIGSGVDIKSANTIIIDNAEFFGLAQLYQLRGRVGRSNIQGFAYIFTSNDRFFSDNISKKFEILESIDKLGSGFIVANHDMDIRGFGSLVGEDQSGKIKDVGIELYHEMLSSAIEEIKRERGHGNVAEKEIDPEIKLGIPIYINDEYINDSNEKMKIYRRIGNIKNLEDLEDFRLNLVEKFGEIPRETQNLLEITKVKNICRHLGVISIDSNSRGFVISFVEQEKYINLIEAYIRNNPKKSKTEAQNKIFISSEINEENIFEKIHHIINEINRLNKLS